jgi:pimeloyl-ACP methyl ester carboxylesterase
MTHESGVGSRNVGRYAPVNGLDLYHERHGDGAPLVLLHGAFGTIESCFVGLLPILAEARHVIAVELQGHGHTADIDRPLTYEHMADDVAALLRLLDVERVDVVGYSMGGAVGLQLAIANPSMVRRLVFAGGASYNASGYYPEFLEVLGTTSVDDLAGSDWERAHLAVAPNPGEWRELVAKVNALDRDFRGWSADDLRAVRAPALLINGDADIIQPEHVVAMFRLLGGGAPADLTAAPESRLALLPGTSHVTVLERVEWVGPMILEFLDCE